MIETDLGLPGYGDGRIGVDDLQPPGHEQINWCKAVVAEFDAADHLDLDNLQHTVPSIYEQLDSDAKSDEESIEAHLAETSLYDYLRDLLYLCRKELRTLEENAKQ